MYIFNKGYLDTEILFIFLLRETHGYHSIHLDIENLQELVLSSYHAKSRDQTQAVRLNGNYPDPQSHLTTSKMFFSEKTNDRVLCRV